MSSKAVKLLNIGDIQYPDAIKLTVYKTDSGFFLVIASKTGGDINGAGITLSKEAMLLLGSIAISELEYT